mgnify:CR=1 FL=1
MQEGFLGRRVAATGEFEVVITEQIIAEGLGVHRLEPGGGIERAPDGQEVAVERDHDDVPGPDQPAVPGLRPANGNGHNSLADQKRAVTPREARDAGASVLVIGRPISAAPDPAAAAAR